MDSQLQAFEGISKRPGLYLYLAEAKGYQIIQYNPKLRSFPIFSVNCQLDCIIDMQTYLQKAANCSQCKRYLELYADPLMSSFLNIARVDLIEKTFCYLPRSSNKWEKIQSFKQEKISHLQYMAALSKLKQDDNLRECINNYYYHSILPNRIQKSFLSDYAMFEQECATIIKVQKGQDNYLFNFLVGEGRIYKISLKLEMGQKIRSFQYGNGFLLIFVEQVEGILFKVLIYDLNEHQLGSVVGLAHEFLGKKQGGDQFFLSLNKQKAKLIQISLSEIKVFTLQNLMKEILSVSKYSFNWVPSLEKNKNIAYVFSIDVQFEQSPQEMKSMEDIQSERLCYMLLDPQQIIIHFRQMIVKAKNTFQISKISNKFYDKSAQKVYFYQFQLQSVSFVIFDLTILSIKVKKIDKENYIQESIFFGTEGNEVELINRNLAIQGCILTFHTFDLLTGGINLVKSCIL